MRTDSRSDRVWRRATFSAVLSIWAFAVGMLLTVQGGTFIRVGHWPDTVRIDPHAVFLDGDRLWVGLMDGLTVLDVSDAEQPICLGRVTFPEGIGAGSICVEGDRVYTANGLQPMQIVDATDSSAPLLLGSVMPSRFVAAIYARKSILYSAHNLNGLGLSDVSEPAQASFGGLTSVAASGPLRAVGQRIYVPVMNGLEIRRYEWPTDLELLGAFETGGMVRAVEVVGDLAYLAAHDGLRILDISDPARITQAGSFACPKTGIGVRVFGAHAFLACDETTFRVVDISDPSQPTLEGEYVAPARVVGFDANATHAFLVVSGLLENSLEVLGLQDPASPVLAIRLSGGDVTSQIELTHNRAYLADGAGGLQILDVQDPGKPILLGNHPVVTTLQSLAADDLHACLGFWGEMLVLDTTVPSQMVPLGSLYLAENVRAIALAGDRVYLVTGMGMGEFIVASLADPSSPTRLGSQWLTTDVGDFRVTADGYIVLALLSQGVEVIDARAPATLKLVASFPATAAVNGIELEPRTEGFRAFLATAQGLEMVDFQPPSSLIPLATLRLEGANAEHIAVAGNRVYLASATRLWAINIADPAHPALEAETTGAFRDLAAESDYVFAAAGLDGMVVWQFRSGPPAPLLHGHSRTEGILLEWAEAGTGWLLQQSAALGDPASWQDVVESKGVTALERSIDEPRRYYRLVKP